MKPHSKSDFGAHLRSLRRVTTSVNFAPWLRKRIKAQELSFHVLCIRFGVALPRNFVCVGRELIARRDFEKADEFLEQGLSSSPEHSGLLIQYAFSAHNSGRYREAIIRWTQARDKHPDMAMTWSGLAANERELGKIDEASSTIAAALQLFPNNLTVISEAARVADCRGAPAEAISLWKRMIEAETVHPDWLQSYLNDLVLLGRFEEATAQLSNALALHPEHRGLLAIRGLLAMAAEDWEGAMSAWQDYRIRFPDDKTGWELLGRTVAAKQHAEAEKEKRTPLSRAHPNILAVEDEDARTMLLGFESIGDDCEFGMVQRRYGAEPLGLLRWNSVSLESLMVALDNRFEGMGEPGNTRLAISGNGEYYVEDERWGLGMHTFLFKSQVDEDTLLPKMCKRVSYLRNKLLEDLKSPDKIFVFKSREVQMSSLQALHAKLRAYGPVRLICVQQANTDPSLAPLSGKAGEVFSVGNDLFVGFIGRLGAVQGYWDIAFDDWMAICSKIHRAPVLPVLVGEA